ncbi:hypothetical protein MKW92_029345 [Papaver armeniacum]|nr:hypothetical protein MKW92_029345 [Papaver armeniacum]
MTSVEKDPYLKPNIGSHNMKLSENAKLRRRKHARENWKNKVKRRKLEAKGQTEANVEEGGPMAAYIEAMAQIVPNVDKGAPEFGQGLDDVDFSIIKIRREKVEYSREEQEKLKCLQEESKDNPGSHPSNEIILEENQQTVVAFCKNENSNLVLSADEVGGESRTSTSISQEDLEELMTSVKEDPYLKTILEDIETGGPTVMMRYLNDSEITQKLALAMGFGVLGGYRVNSVEHNAPNTDAEDQTAKQA